MKRAIAIILFPMLFGLCMMLYFMLFQVSEQVSSENEMIYGNVGFSAEVESYRALITMYAKQYGVEEYIDYLLAIMQVESGGGGNDPMQSSESLGLPVNTLQPGASVEQGVKYFASCLELASSKGCDVDTALQSYNYGAGFIGYVEERGKKYTFELAEEFSKERANGLKIGYSNPIAVAKNGGWRYRYGNMFYVLIVKQHLGVAQVGEAGTVGAGETGNVDTNARMRWLFPNGTPTNAAQMSPYLATIVVPIINEQGQSTTMRLTVHHKLANEFQGAFREMYRIGFKVKASTTAVYNWRMMVSGAAISHHSYGCAIDLNWGDNPYTASQNPNWRINEYSVTPQVVAIWKRHGFFWGGDWSGMKDYMHFSYTNH